MTEEDFTAIMTKFVATPLIYNQGNVTVTMTASQKLYRNQPISNVDETKPWVRFVINSGNGEKRYLGDDNTYMETGHIALQVFAPKGTGDRAARQVASCFKRAFRNWRSSDGKLYIESNGVTREIDGDDYLQINVILPCTSIRKSA